MARPTRPTLIVVDTPDAWPLGTEGVELVPARDYLADPRFFAMRGARVFNLCRSYRYQSQGYYVSLLAAARGHRPLPGISALQDLRTPGVVRHLSEELDGLIQRSLRPIRSREFVLSIYFGRNLARRYDRLARLLFLTFQAPLLRAAFVRGEKNGRWQLQSIAPLAGSEIPEEHRPFAVETAREFFAGKRLRERGRPRGRYDLAILVNEDEGLPPSNPRALRRFLRAAERAGFAAELIRREDFGRLAEFDALLIRETTNVNHHTYRFARRAAAEGLVVLDDPDSILKCTNKVFLAELLVRHRIATPRTLVLHRGNLGEALPELGLPCILKQPDSSFSQGVVKAESEAGFAEAARALLQKSELVVGQEFMPTPFDWRIGILDRQPLYACKYYMAKEHWQILKQDAGKKPLEGASETLPLEEVPKAVLRTALKAANLIGDGFYGVDLKEVGKKVYVIEVNDNPSVDAGVEDLVLGEELYDRVMEVMMRRVEARKGRA